MTLRAGFAEIDITPPLGTSKIGWLRQLNITSILDPIFARVAILESETGRVGFIALDTLSVRWSTVTCIRQEITRQFAFPGDAVMIGATHNHGGPAVANVGDVRRDEGYITTLVDKCVEAFGIALKNRVEAEVGVGSCFEFNVAFNRRVVQRDGTVKTHGTFTHPGAMCLEGTIDPEVAVLAARSLDGRPLGVIVNFTCHPTHVGGTEECSAGWPGAMSKALKESGWPVPLFLQGAAGEIHTSNPMTNSGLEMEPAGKAIAQDALKVIEAMKFQRGLKTLASRSVTVQLPYRRPSPEEIKGTLRGAQRFIDPAIYDRGMPALMERIRTRRLQPAEVQAIFVDDLAYVSIPAEYFCELGLRIKQESNPRHALIVGYANGMVGYVPDQRGFAHGGYETTFAMSSRLAPEAGDLLADAAVELVRGFA